MTYFLKTERAGLRPWMPDDELPVTSGIMPHGGLRLLTIARMLGTGVSTRTGTASEVIPVASRADSRSDAYGTKEDVFGMKHTLGAGDD